MVKPWRLLLLMPARRLLPLLLALGTVLGMGLRYIYQVGDIRDEVVQRESQRLRERLSIEQSRLDVDLGSADLLAVRRLVSALALHQGITDATLADADGAVLASLSRAHIGRSVGIVFGAAEDARMREAAIGELPAALQVQADPGRNTLTGIVPLVDHARLLVRMDLSHPLAVRMAGLQRDALREAVMVALAVAALALLLHGLWFRRARWLVMALESIGQGNLSRRVGLSGRDELSVIAQAINRMAEQLEREQRALREQGEELRLFYDLPFIGMAVSSPHDRRWLRVNDRLCQILGYSREEMLRRTWAEMTLPEDLGRNMDLFEDLVAGRRDGYRLEKRFMRKDGGVVHTEIDVRAVRNGDGSVRHLLTTIQDVSARKAAEAALQHSREELLKVQEIGRMGSWSQELPSGLFTWSPQTHAIHETAPDQGALTLRAILDMLHPDDVPRVRQAYEQSLASGSPYDIRYRLRMKDGRIKHLHVKGEFECEAGQPVRSIGMVHDETELITARMERDRLASVMETTTDIVSMADPQGRVFYFNRAGYELLGLDPSQPVDDAIRGVHPSWAAKIVMEEGIPTAIRKGRWLGETAVFDAHGREVPMSQLIMAHHDGAGRLDYVWSILRDMSERKAFEAELDHERRQLADAQAVAHIGSWAMDWPAARITGSAEFFRILDMDEEGAGTLNLRALRPVIHPQDLHRVVEMIKDLTRRHEAGMGRLEHRIRTSRGVRHVEVRVRMLTDAQGQVGRWLGTLQDITEMVEAEEKLRQANLELERRVAERTVQLRQANQELEAFSYSVSHDLKAPLRGIDGYSQLLLEEYGERLDAEGLRFLERIRNGVRFMGDLIADLLAYSRMERRDMASNPVALRPLVDSVLEGFRADIERQGAQVSVVMDDFSLQLDRDGIAVAMRNLIGNALKFSRHSHPPVVEIGSHRQAGRRVVWVRDNGVGFDMKYHDRMFGIFQRLHRTDEFPGSGVGLALVAKAAQRMGGRVWAEGAPGQGATFYMEFPE